MVSLWFTGIYLEWLVRNQLLSIMFPEFKVRTDRRTPRIGSEFARCQISEIMFLRGVLVRNFIRISNAGD